MSKNNTSEQTSPEVTPLNRNEQMWNENFTIDGVGTIKLGDLVQLAQHNIQKLDLQMQAKKRPKKKILTEVANAKNVLNNLYNGNIIGVDINGNPVYVLGFSEENKIPVGDYEYLTRLVLHLPQNAKFIRFQAAKPTPKAETKPLPVYTNSAFFDYGTNRGWYNGDVLDLGTYEASDLNAKGELVSDAGRLQEIRDRIESFGNFVGDGTTSNYNFDGTAGFRTYEEFKNAVDAVKAASDVAAMRRALSIFHPKDESNWFRAVKQETPPPVDTRSEQEIAFLQSVEALEKQKLEELTRQNQANVLWNNGYFDTTIVPTLTDFVLKDESNNLNSLLWMNPASLPSFNHDPYTKNSDASINWQAERKRNAENIYKVLMDYIAGNESLFYNLNQFNDQELLLPYLQYMFNELDTDPFDHNNYVWAPEFVDKKTGRFYIYNPATNSLQIKSFKDANDKIKQLVKDYHEAEFKKTYGKTKVNLNGGTLHTLKALRNGGTLKALAGIQFVYVSDVKKQRKKDEQKARRENPSAEDPEYVKTAELVGAVLDTLGLIGSFIPGYGGAVSAALGGLGSISAFTAGIARDGFQWRDDLGQFAFNLGSDLMGVIPGLGTAAKTKKFVKALPKLVNIIGIANFSVDAQQTIAKLNQNNWDVSVLTKKDYMDLAQSILPLASGIGRMRNNIKTKKIVEKGIEKWGLDETAAIKEVIEKGNYGIKNAATRMQWLNGSSDKLDDIAMGIYGPTERTLRVVTPAAEEVVETATKRNPGKIAEYVGKGIGKTKQFFKDVGLVITDVVDSTNYDKNGGKLELLKSLRRGGVIKASLGAVTGDWSSVTNLDDYKELYKFRQNQLRTPVVDDINWDTDTGFQTFIKDQNLLNETLTARNLLGEQITNPFSKNVDDLNFKNPNTDALNLTRLGITLGANNAATRQTIDSTLDNIVLKKKPQLLLDSLRSDFNSSMGLLNKLAQNTYNQMSTLSGTDLNDYRQGMLGALQINENASLLNNLANAQMLSLQQDRITDQLNEQAKIDTLYHNDNMSTLSAGATAVNNLETANMLNNAKAVADSIAEKTLDINSTTKEFNSGKLQVFSDSNALAYETAVKQLEDKYKILPTDSEFVKAAKKDAYTKALEQLLTNLQESNLQARELYNSQSNYWQSLYDNMQDRKFIRLDDRLYKSMNDYLNSTIVPASMSDITDDWVKGILDKGYKSEHLDRWLSEHYAPKQAKGGKLDNKTRLEIENYRALSKQVIQLLKNHDKGLDRLSKVTYKAILKSLGLT